MKRHGDDGTMMPTYSIRVEPYADNAGRHYVFTIKADGCAHHFADDLTARRAAKLADDLSRLNRSTVAILVGDYDTD